MPHIGLFLTKLIYFKGICFEFKIVLFLCAVLAEQKYYRLSKIWMITREKILETATQLFTLYGVKTVTMTKIAQTLHTSKRTLYNQFPDKTKLLKACVTVYHEKVRKENEEIIQSAPNSIAAMGLLMQKILERSMMINPNFYADIFHYYPGLMEELTGENGNYPREQMFFLAKSGIEDGIFIKDLDMEVVGTTVLHLLKLFKDNQKFPINRFSKERLVFSIMVPYMKGLCTPKGLKILEKQEELFKVSL